MERNLKFMIIDALLDENEENDYDTMFDEARERAEEDYQNDEIPEAVAFFEKYELTQSALDSIEEICFDGGNYIFLLLATSAWGGETDTFDVSSLEGIEVCRNLKRLIIISMYSGGSIKPLAVLEKLEELSFPGYTDITDLEVLLGLPNLKSLRLDWKKSTDQNKDKVKETLMQRNVMIYE